MAEIILSPGVLANENDQSQVRSLPSVAGAAIIGPTVKGKPNIPRLITTFSEFQAEFGTTFVSGSSEEFSFLTSISANNYFAQGGTSLLVTRVANGNFSPATSSLIQNNIVASTGTFATASIDITSFTVADTGSGKTFSIEDAANLNVYYFQARNFDFINNTSDFYYFDTNGGSTGWTLDEWGAGVVRAFNNNSFDGSTLVSASYDASTNILGITSSQAGTAHNGIEFFTQIDYIGAPTSSGELRGTLSGASEASVGNNTFTLETLSEGVILNSTSTETTNGVLPNGTSDNFRYEITSPNIDQGVFTLVIRRGDDRNNAKSILETFSNVSLDPKQSNYIERVVGNQIQNVVGAGTTDVYVRTSGSYPNGSRYVRVKSVDYATPDYFDNNGNPKTAFTASIPIAQSGTLGGAAGEVYTGTNTLYENIGTTTQGLADTDYTDAINILANKDEYSFNVISAPGLINADHATPVGNLIEMVENRGDAIAVIDTVRYGSTIASATTEAGERDSSFASTYWPWLQISEPTNGQIVWVPASTLIPGVYANTDATAETWFAPAGFNRGGLLGVVQAERKLSQSQRDTLYVGKVNPIATFPGRGVVVFGQKTLQQQSTALDRVNVRRLLISLKSFISQVADNLVFEQNTSATRNNFIAQVNPFLESVQQRQGLFAFKVVMDDTNNTPDVIDRNQLVGQIFIQPTRTAEFILLDFNILPTGATFPS